MSDFSIAFYIGPIPIPWYGIFVTLGLLASALATYIEWKRKNYSTTIFAWLFIVVVLSGFFGARWFYLIFNPEDIYAWWSFITISGGRSIIGGVIFSTLITSAFIKLAKIEIDRREIMSIILPNILLAQAIGRWGNFFNQELYGQIANDISFLPEFISEGMYIEVDGQYNYYQPLFLYESILNLFGWLVITFLLKNIKSLKPGTQASFYFIFYGLIRSSMELFRDPQFIMQINEFPTSFFWALLYIVFGFLSFYIFQYKYYYVDYYFNEVYKLQRSYLIENIKLYKYLFRNKYLYYYIYRNKSKNNYLQKLNQSKILIGKYKLWEEENFYVKR